MPTLHVMFDLDEKKFVGGSISGKFLPPLASVTLTNGSISVLDSEGRDVLGLSSRKATGPTSELSKAQVDIARMFGVTEDEADGDEDVSFADWTGGRR